jgi:hypothetical protein
MKQKMKQEFKRYYDALLKTSNECLQIVVDRFAKDGNQLMADFVLDAKNMEPFEKAFRKYEDRI